MADSRSGIDGGVDVSTGPSALSSDGRPVGREIFAGLDGALGADDPTTLGRRGVMRTCSARSTPFAFDVPSTLATETAAGVSSLLA